MLSTHIPSFAGGLVTVTGEAIVDTQLREIQTFVAVFKTNNFVPDQEAKVSWYAYTAGGPGKVVVRVEKSGANDGLLGTNPVEISWMALGL